MGKGMVQTVLGPILPDELGVTYSHEHLAAHATPELQEKDCDLILDDPSQVVEDLLAFRGAGGSALVEMTTRDYGHDPAVLLQLAQETGVRVIAATGFNKGVYCRAYCEGADPGELAKVQVTDVLEGIGETGVRSGVHKFGTSLDVIHPWEEVAARAAARAHLDTGAPIITHTEAGTMAGEQLDLLASEGIPADHVILCHMDRNPDLDLHRTLIERGAYLSYDQIPKPKYDTENGAIRLIVALAREGLHDHILVSGDFSRRSYFSGWGGAPGLTYLLTTFSERLQEALVDQGLDADQVLGALFVRNPARALAFRG